MVHRIIRSGSGLRTMGAIADLNPTISDSLHGSCQAHFESLTVRLSFSSVLLLKGVFGWDENREEEK